LDVLAADGSAEERLARLLTLLARTAGARRAAVVADGLERRAAVSIGTDEDPESARELAAWLDANSPRSRARQAAAGPAPISFIVGAIDAPPTATAERRRERTFAVLPIASAGDVALGFEFARPAEARALAQRLPSTLARHAAVALALVTSQLADERELATLRARDAERSVFVSTVAHELRTPLTGLQGYLELILEGKVADRAVELEFLDRSQSIVTTMADLVGDLLELSRLDSGALELELSPFSVAEAGGQVAASLLPIAISRDVRLTTSLPPRMRVATGDRRRVEQILTNLAGNALKFTPQGGTVQIVAEVAGLVAALIVRDDGPGIPPDERSRIFERFQRMPDHEHVEGTGLGLPIARELARRMGGDLAVASVADAGSSFVLVLPGPSDVDRAVIDSALAEVVEREEIALEERIVRRAMQRANRDDQGGDPRAAADLIEDEDLLDAATRPPGPGVRGSGPGRLRVLPSLGPATRA
jgi:signal transduction histidine kinase